MVFINIALISFYCDNYYNISIIIYSDAGRFIFIGRFIIVFFIIIFIFDTCTLSHSVLRNLNYGNSTRSGQRRHLRF